MIATGFRYAGERPSAPPASRDAAAATAGRAPRRSARATPLAGSGAAAGRPPPEPKREPRRRPSVPFYRKVLAQGTRGDDPGGFGPELVERRRLRHPDRPAQADGLSRGPAAVRVRGPRAAGLGFSRARLPQRSRTATLDRRRGRGGRPPRGALSAAVRPRRAAPAQPPARQHRRPLRCSARRRSSAPWRGAGRRSWPGSVLGPHRRGLRRSRSRHGGAAGAPPPRRVRGAGAARARGAWRRACAVRGLGGPRHAASTIWTLGARHPASAGSTRAVQGLLPNRMYDLRDVGFNALAAGLALAAATAMRAAMTGDRAPRERAAQVTSELQTILAPRSPSPPSGGLAVGIEREWSARRRGEPAALRRRADLPAPRPARRPRGGALLARSTPRIGARPARRRRRAGARSPTSSRRGAGRSTPRPRWRALLVLGAGAARRLRPARRGERGLRRHRARPGREEPHARRGRAPRSDGLEAGARFAVLALVVLPLLPAEPIAAFGGLGGSSRRSSGGSC